MNGYYALSNLNPYSYDFSQSHSMVVNIVPDYENNEFAEIWCNTGLFNELNADVISEQEQNGRGMEISTSDVLPGEPFSVLTDCLSGPINFEGSIALCVVDKDNKIKEILSEKQARGLQAPGEPFPYCNLNGREIRIWENIVYNGPINEGYHLCLFAKRNDEQNWLLINSTDQAPCYLPLHGNSPTLIKPNVNVHCKSEELDNIRYSFPIFRNDQTAVGDLFCRNGIGHLFCDGKYKSTASDFVVADVSNYRPKSLQMDIDIYYYPYEDLVSRTIEVSTPGTLKDLILPSDTLNLYNLKSTGELNSKDLDYITHLHALGVLDLSEASIPSGFRNGGFQFIPILYLPNSLRNINTTYVPPYEGNTAILLNVPASTYDLGTTFGSSFIKFNSQNPPKVNDVLLDNYRFVNLVLPQLIIFVPKGSKRNYQSDPVWGRVLAIEECDEPINASWNLPYLNITDSFCILCGVPDFIDAGLIPYLPESWETEFKKYPARYFDIPSEVFHNNHNRQLRYMKNVVSSSFDHFNGRDMYFMPSEGFINGSSNNPYFPKLSLQYIITPRLKANFSGIEGTVLLPDHSDIGVNDDYDSTNNLYERHEMFKLYKQESKNLISVVPNLEGISIESIVVNNNIIKEDNNLYHVDFSVEPNITVNYNVYGLKTLSTEYPYTLIKGLPETELSISSVETIENDPVDSFNIYNLQGICIRKCSDKSYLSELPSGIYIVNGTKIYIH